MCHHSTSRRTLMLAVALMLGTSTACVVDGDVAGENDVWECTTDDDCIDGFQCVVDASGVGRCADDVPPVFCLDSDGDEFVAPPSEGIECAPGAVLDCDDTNRNVNPTATEVCNGVDDDCDGDTDEDIAQIACPLTEGVCAGVTTTCVDGAPATCDYGTDFVAEEAGALCSDSLDNDCDGITDSDPECPTCMDGDPCTGVGCFGNLPAEQCACAAAGTKVCEAVGESCVDGNGQLIPSPGGTQPELCNNGIDDDCDGQVDEAGCQ